MNIHSLCAPSSANRWAQCTASVYRIAEKRDDNEESKYASEGQERHKWLEMLLSCRTELQDVPEHLRAEIVTAYTAIQDALKDVDDFSIKATEMTLPCTRGIEALTGVKLDAGMCDGTADLVVFDARAREVYVVDAKFGRIAVPPTSLQLVVYAAGALEWSKQYTDGAIERVHLVIVQPFISSDPLCVSASVDEIKQKVKSIVAPLQRISKKDVTATPSNDNCKYCRAKLTCKEYETWLLRRDVIEPPSVFDLEAEGIEPLPETPEGELTLAKAYAYYKSIKAWGEAVEELFKDHLKNEGPLGGFEWGYLRKGLLKWSTEDADEVAARLEVDVDQIVVKKLLTPTQVQKILKKPLNGLAERAPDIYGIKEV